MIYCVEDDAGIRELVVYTLQNTGGWRRGASPMAKPCSPLCGSRSPTCCCSTSCCPARTASPSCAACGRCKTAKSFP